MKTCRDSRAAGKALVVKLGTVGRRAQVGLTPVATGWGELRNSGGSSGAQVAAQALTDSHKANIFPFDFHPEKNLGLTLLIPRVANLPPCPLSGFGRGIVLPA